MSNSMRMMQSTSQTRWLLLTVFSVLIVLSALFYATTRTREVALPQTPTSTPPTPTPEPTPTTSIVVTTPLANAVVTGPLIIEGQASGPWFFEASFPVEIRLANGQIVAQAPAQALSNWMTTDAVPFQAVLQFNVTSTQAATLILRNSNASGLPENDAEFSFPIILEPTVTAQRAVKLFFFNPKMDQDESGNLACSSNGLVGVERIIPTTATPLQDTLRLLLSGGLTATEKAAGITTEFPLDGVTLTNATLVNGTATVNLEDSASKTSGGACRAGILALQIEATAKQFPGVTKVEFKPDTLFQP